MSKKGLLSKSSNMLFNILNPSDNKVSFKQMLEYSNTSNFIKQPVKVQYLQLLGNLFRLL